MYICVDWCQVIYIYAFFQLTSFDVDYGGGIHISVHSINEQPKKKCYPIWDWRGLDDALIIIAKTKKGN